MLFSSTYVDVAASSPRDNRHKGNVCVCMCVCVCVCYDVRFITVISLQIAFFSTAFPSDQIKRFNDPELVGTEVQYTHREQCNKSLHVGIIVSRLLIHIGFIHDIIRYYPLFYVLLLLLIPMLCVSHLCAD